MPAANAGRQWAQWAHGPGRRRGQCWEPRTCRTLGITVAREHERSRVWCLRRLSADRAVSRTRGPGQRRGLTQMPCNLCGPRSAPSATPAAVSPRGHTGRVDVAARLERQQLTLSPICQVRARRSGGGDAWSLALSGTAVWAATRQPHGGECRQVRRVELLGPPTGGPSTTGARRATRTGHLGQTPKGAAPAEPAEESDAITQRGQWRPRGRYTACNVWGKHLLESGGGRSPAAGLRPLVLPSLQNPACNLSREA